MRTIKRVIHWSLFALIALYLLTGFGIVEYRTVGALTFGLLDRNLSSRIHTVLWIPFVILLTLHILLVDRWAERIFRKLKS